MMDAATIDKLTQLLTERKWAKFFSSSFNTPFNPKDVHIHREYQQRDSEIPKGYRWRMHNRACGMTQSLVEVQGYDIRVIQPPRIQRVIELKFKVPQLSYLKDKETVTI